MTTRHSDLRDAVATVSQELLLGLAARHGDPLIDEQFDPSRWKRHGQESFAVNRHRVWRRPAETFSTEWLDGLAAMERLRAIVAADDGLSQRFDRMVGTEFWRTRRDLADVLVSRILTPLVVDTGSYRFDRDKFDAIFATIEVRLLADRVSYVDFIPIPGLALASGPISLPGDLILRDMSDREIGAALAVLAVPVDRHDTPTSITVSRYNQAALTLEHHHPFVAERDMPGQTTAPVVPPVDEAGAQLIPALRIVCGGSTTATRPLRMLHPDELEATSSGQAILTPLDSVDSTRPTIVFGDHVGELRRVLQLVRSPAALKAGALQVALRRLVFAGGRTRPEDRLIDLIICAEALFIKHTGLSTNQQSKVIAAEAEQLLGSDPDLNLAPGEAGAFMKAAYGLRNAEVHGDAQRPALVDLRGNPADKLENVVADLDRIMRRACRLRLDSVGQSQ